MDSILNILISFITLIFLLIIVLFILRVIFDFKAKKNGIFIVILFFLPIRIIKYSNVVEVKKISFIQSLCALSIRRFNMLNMMWDGIILIRLRKGFFNEIVITPSNINKFIETVSEEIKMEIDEHKNNY